MNVESLRNDPTAKELIEILFPDKIAEARAEGVKLATEDLMRRLTNVLSAEQIQQLKGDVGIMEPTRWDLGDNKGSPLQPLNRLGFVGAYHCPELIWAITKVRPYNLWHYIFL